MNQQPAFPKPGPKPKKPRQRLQRTPVARGKRPSPINKERRGELHILHFSGGFNHHLWIRKLPCCGCEWQNQPQQSETQAAHAVSRGAGGRWYDQAPLCNECHRAQENNPKAWRWLRRKSRSLAVEHMQELTVKAA